jgi:energy-coupling factor transporter ATP-binding protein EcfA2
MEKRLLRLELNRWKQFANNSFNLSQPVTVLTGANGTGKTSILQFIYVACRQDFNIEIPLAPEMPLANQETFFHVPADPETYQGGEGAHSFYQIGRVAFSDGSEQFVLADVTRSEPDFRLVGSARSDQRTDGGLDLFPIFVPANRQGFRPIQINGIRNDVYAWWNVEDRHDPVASNMAIEVAHGLNIEEPSNLSMKEALISWAVFGYGSEVVAADRRLQELFDGFTEIARRLLPETLRFRRFSVRKLELVVETETSVFPFDSLSGGLVSVLEIAWMMFFKAPDRQEHVLVLIDEPENHLHAGMQRALLPQLIDLFPKAQIIVSTHSPMIVGSVRDSSVYALRVSEDGIVENFPLDIDEWAGTASEILRDVLGLDATLPIWAVERLERIALEASRHELSSRTLSDIRKQLAQDGLEEFAPTLIADRLQREETNDSNQ